MTSRWVVFYAALAVVTGATSFNRKYPVRFAAEYQHRAWDTFLSRGTVNQSAERDYNLEAYAKRVLMPLLTATLAEVSGLPWVYCFSLLRLLMIFAAYVVFHLYLLRHGNDTFALSGTLFVAATMPLTFKDWWEIPTDFPEMLTFTAAVWAMEAGRVAWLPAITFLGAMNRESALLLPILGLITAKSVVEVKHRLPHIIAAGALWLTVFLGIQQWTTLQWPNVSAFAASHAMTGISRLMENFNPYNNSLYYFYLFGSFWILPILRWKDLPPFQRRCLLIAPVHVLIAFWASGGRSDEPRHLVALYPILVPAGLMSLRNGTRAGARPTAALDT